MTIDITEYDYSILARVEAILQAEMAVYVTTVNTELGGIITLVDPTDAQKAARSDARLDEKSLPQDVYGIWSRITGVDEVLGVGSQAGGQSRTVHSLEITTFARVQAKETGSVHATTLTSGYKTAMLLARTATLAVQQKIIGTAGVYNILRVSGSRLPSPVKDLTYVHQVRDFFDVYQTTRR